MAFNIDGFLLSALVDFPEVNSKGEKKVDQAKKYATFLVDAELAGEKTLSKLTEERLVTLGIPLGHAIAIAEAAQNFGNKAQLILEEKMKQLEASMKSIAIEKKFTINGAIVDSQLYFMVDVSNSNESVLKLIDSSAYVLLQGHRGSGKSTRCYWMRKRQLRLLSISISLQCGFSDETHFWPRFLNLFQEALSFENLPFEAQGLERVDDFHKWICQVKQDFVLFIDEFDLLLQPRFDRVRNELLDLLRSLKELYPQKRHYLKSVVAIGPSSILEVSQMNISPFNVGDVWVSPYFSLEDIHSLIKQLKEQEKIEIDPEIEEDIYLKTSGHPGLTCFCLKRIHEKLARTEQKVLFDSWRQYVATSFYGEVTSWATMGKLSDVVLQLNETQRDFLIQSFLITSMEKPVEISKYEDLKTAKFLAAEGALRMIGTTFEIPSPAIHNILLRSVRKTIPLPSSFPQEDSYVFDLFRIGLPFFDKEVMRKAPQISYKKNEANGSKRGEKVPCENTYHFELTLLLRNWLLRTGITTEVSATERKSLDILLNVPEIGLIALELVAHAQNGPDHRPGSVYEHFVRCQKDYKSIVKAKEAWVVNFTITTDPTCFVWPTNDEVKALHISHDLKWTTAHIFRSANDTGISVTL